MLPKFDAAKLLTEDEVRKGSVHSAAMRKYWVSLVAGKVALALPVDAGALIAQCVEPS
jgi:hypothetical protein